MLPLGLKSEALSEKSGIKCNFMVSDSQCVCFSFDDECSATGEGQRGLCEANNNHPVLS